MPLGLVVREDSPNCSAFRRKAEEEAERMRVFGDFGRNAEETAERGIRREWDSNSPAPFRICKLQIPRCRGCRGGQRCRGALHAVARRISRCEQGAAPAKSSWLFSQW